MSETTGFSWIQPICAGCYNRRYPGRDPACFSPPGTESCCDCGNTTVTGIYMRVDPGMVAYPTLSVEDL